MNYFAQHTVLKCIVIGTPYWVAAFLTATPFLTGSSAASIDSFDYCFLFFWWGSSIQQGLSLNEVAICGRLSLPTIIDD